MTADLRPLFHATHLSLMRQAYARLPGFCSCSSSYKLRKSGSRRTEQLTSGCAALQQEGGCERVGKAQARSSA